MKMFFVKRSSGYRFRLLTLFWLGFLVRFVPELIALLITPYPIGFDTIGHYAPTLLGFDRWRLEPLAAPLIYLLLVPFVRLFDVFVVLRIAACVLYGLLAVSSFYFANSGLKWGLGKSFIASTFLILQPASLRISLDLFRIELALVFLLLLLPWLKKVSSKHAQVIVGTLSLLIVMTHEMVSASLFFIIVGLGAFWFWEKRKNEAIKLMLASLPAFTIFTVMTCMALGLSDVPWARYGLTNYLDLYGGSYLSLLGDVWYNLFMYLLCLLPLMLLGLWRDRLQGLWSLFLLCASFGCLVFPWLALSVQLAWMLMLALPLSFYAVNGLDRLGLFKRTIRARAGLLVVLVFFGVLASVYIPTNMVRSSIDLRDIPDTLNGMKYLDGKMDNSSCVLLEERFKGWGLLYLSEDKTIITYPPGLPYNVPRQLMRYLDNALNEALQKGFTRIYLVWYVHMNGNTEFKEVYRSGKIAIYIYEK